jgi:hypothetical protein
MSDGILDRDVLARIGTEALEGAGFSGDVLKQWRRRGISWKARPDVKQLAIENGVDLPADFDRVQRPIPKASKRKRPAPKKRKVA